MKNARLTFQTENHDFYVGNAESDMATIYNILPKGSSPGNVGGYYNPEYLLAVKGYLAPGKKLTVKQAFGI
jgi:hypothetical protein